MNCDKKLFDSDLQQWFREIVCDSEILKSCQKMGEGTKYATTAGDVRKFIEQINYQEIDEGEVSDL